MIIDTVDTVDPADGRRYIYIDGHDERVCDKPTLSSYVFGGCRCSACRETNRAHKLAYQRRPVCPTCQQRIRLPRKQKGAA